MSHISQHPAHAFTRRPQSATPQQVAELESIENRFAIFGGIGLLPDLIQSTAQRLRLPEPRHGQTLLFWFKELPEASAQCLLDALRSRTP